jgi:hypothetical protein
MTKRVLIALILLGSTGCEDGSTCDSATLASELQRAVRGDTVRVGTCIVTGSFQVPDGVSLQGAGQDNTYLVWDGEQPVLEVTPGSAAASISDLSIRSGGVAGILAEGRGQVHLARLHVAASRGLGIALEGLDVADLTDVAVLGMVTEANVARIPNEPATDEFSTHGLVLVEVRQATFTDVSASGYARMGMLLVEGATEYRGGQVTKNLSTGLMVYGGEATLADVRLCETFEGSQVMPAYDAVFAGSSVVSTERVELCESEGPGMLQDSSTSTNVDLVATGNRHGGAWVQSSPLFEVSGSESRFLDNGLAGVLAVDTADVSLRGGSFEGMREEQRLFVGLGPVTLGDGFHSVRPSGRVRVEDVAFSRNARVGMLFELEGDAPADLHLSEVVVDGIGSQRGAVAQGDAAAIPEEWDEGVERLGDTIENDQDPPRLDIAAILPASEFPSAEAIRRDGLAALIDH